MINTEAEYEQAQQDIRDLKKRYRELSAYDKSKPYIGQQMARDINRLIGEVKLFEYDRPEKRFSTEQNRR